MAGIGITIFVLIIYTICLNLVFIPAGRFDRLPPFVAVSITEIIFAAIALHGLAIKNGWYWQLREAYAHWNAERAAAGEP